MASYNNVKSPCMEASDMLAEALKQMDGLLAGTGTTNNTRTDYSLRNGTNGLHNSHQELESPTLPHKLHNVHQNQNHENKVVTLLEDLRSTLETMDNRDRSLNNIPTDTQVFFKRWLQQSLDRQELAKSNQDTHKLDLMAEISSLKLRLASSDKDRADLRERLDFAQRRIDDLQSRLNDRTVEVTDLRTRLAKNGTITPSSPDHPDSGRPERTLERERTLDRLKRKHTEVEKLKKAVETLMITNSEKDRHIDDLKRSVKRFRRIEEMVLASQGRKGLEQLYLDDDQSDSSSTQNSAGSGGADHVGDLQQLERLEIVEAQDLRQYSHTMPFPSATSTPVNYFTSAKPPLPNGSQTLQSPPSSIHHQSPMPRKSPSIARSNSYEEITPAPKTPPTVRRRGEGFGTCPRDVRLNVVISPQSPGGASSKSAKRSPSPGPSQTSTTMPRNRSKKGFMSFGKGLFKLKRGKWSSSAPNLAQGETDEETLKDEMAQEYKTLQSQTSTGSTGPTHEHRKKQKGLKRFFKLKRSNSQDMEENLEEFKRGGTRSTAGPRLGWSRDFKYSDIDVPFARWDGDRISLWMHNLGLSMYVGDCKRWAKNGDQLLKATPHDLEKELGMRNHFHRKKLQLALQAIGSQTTNAVDKLDHNWVTRWLDDIGLPQYKDTFSEARIDGRMLHYMTIDDLVTLRVTNTLHHLSIKRGIQVLRMNNFNPACLRRRPAPDEGSLRNCPLIVMLWTNHRIMDWLRSIDLSEYAPNLRGSGVHGGLMVLEPKFSAEILATILSISGTKTLLRRHLSTHFVTLIGSDVQAKKREEEIQPGYTPLTPNQKIKVRKNFGLFSHRRTRSDPEEDYVCPLSLKQVILEREAQVNGGVNHQVSGSTLPRPPREAPNLLARDRFLDDVPTSNV